jgi:hypothetical protein
MKQLLIALLLSLAVAWPLSYLLCLNVAYVRPGDDVELAYRRGAVYLDRKPQSVNPRGWWASYSVEPAYLAQVDYPAIAPVYLLRTTDLRERILALSLWTLSLPALVAAVWLMIRRRKSAAGFPISEDKR